MKEIQLTQGYVAMVDDEDCAALSMYAWRAVVGKRANGETRVYASGRVCGVNMYMHKLLMGNPDGLDVDHIDGDQLNNTKSNLRVCTRRENLQNSMPSGRGTSKYKGVSWEAAPKKWRSRIMVNGKPINLGFFNTQEDAAKAYDNAAILHFGEYARTNSICAEKRLDKVQGSPLHRDDWKLAMYADLAERVSKQLNMILEAADSVGANVPISVDDGRVVVIK